MGCAVLEFNILRNAKAILIFCSRFPTSSSASRGNTSA